MNKFLLYDYGQSTVWSEKLIVDEPALLKDCKEGLCDYVATIFIEKNVARLSVRIGVPILRYAKAIEEKTRQNSKSLIVFHDDDQNKKLVNFFIANGWAVKRINPDTMLLNLKES